MAALRDAVSERGEIVGTPVLFEGQWVVFLGTPRVTQVALRISLTAAPPKVERLPLPPALRVLTTAQRGGRLYALVESVAWNGQPAGLRTFLALDPTDDPMLRPDERAKIAAGPPEDFAARLASAPPGVPDDNSDPDALVARLRSGLASLLAPDVAIGRKWQPFFETVPRPDANALTTLGSQVFLCLIDGCYSYDGADRLAAIHVVDRKGTKAVVALALTPPPTPPGRGKPHVVSSVPDDGTIARAIRLLGIADARILGVAPLGPPGGLLGVIAVADRASDYEAIIVDDDVVASTPIAVSLEQKGVGLAFADVDGDGRTDFVMSGMSRAPRGRGTRMFLTPQTPAEVESIITQDAIGFFALLGARSVEDGRARAIAAPTGGVTRAEACPLVTALEKETSAARVLVPQPMLFTYREPGWFEGSARRASLQQVVRETPCASLECSASRPTCTHSDPPLHDYFLFRRDGGVLKIAGVIRYTGS